MTNDSPQKIAEVHADLERVINKHSLENDSGTPDYVLASYLYACLQAWNEGLKTRDRWWGFDPTIKYIPAETNGDPLFAPSGGDPAMNQVADPTHD